ncbi:MAG: cytochrome C oxidase subunit IV family protein [Rhodothermales bacterium]|nr:cytochrome C oxidase subunit IV family protein [Rhodothermales bacterium]MBO6779171.1 cytochrome C oxidase subunit IV family protein [Rhodothermales bacterium]
MAHGHHISSTRLLVTVFGALVFLTIITVITSRMDLGALDVPVALAIASLKAALVVGYFMMLKYDNRVNALVFAVGSLFVVVFLVFTLLDTTTRGDLPNTVEGTIMEEQRDLEALEARAADVPAADAQPAN